MIPTQTPRMSAPPVADVREGASLPRTGAAGVDDVPPVATPGRSTEQMCDQCGRTAAIKVTVDLGRHRVRFCAWCAGRGEKTTVVRPVVCAHPYRQAHRVDGQLESLVCTECFEAVADDGYDDPPETRCPCDLCRDAGHAGLSLVVPVIFAAIMVALAIASGTLRAAILALPLPEPGLTGWPVMVLLVVAVGAWRHLSRSKGPGLEQPDDAPGVNPWFGSPPRDLDLDPDEARPGLLPRCPGDPYDAFDHLDVDDVDWTELLTGPGDEIGGYR